MSVVQLIWSVLRQSRLHSPATGGDSPEHSLNVCAVCAKFSMFRFLWGSVSLDVCRCMCINVCMRGVLTLAGRVDVYA